MLPLIFANVLSPEIFNNAEKFGAGVICMLIINLIYIISKTYLAGKKNKGEQDLTAQDHLHAQYLKFIDELQDTINQLVNANSSLRQELIEKMQKLIEENAKYKTKLDYIENSNKFLVSTVKDIKNGNGNGHEKDKPKLPDK